MWPGLVELDNAVVLACTPLLLCPSCFGPYMMMTMMTVMMTISTIYQCKHHLKSLSAPSSCSGGSAWAAAGMPITHLAAPMTILFSVSFLLAAEKAWSSCSVDDSCRTINTTAFRANPTVVKHMQNSTPLYDARAGHVHMVLQAPIALYVRCKVITKPSLFLASSSHKEKLIRQPCQQPAIKPPGPM